MSRILITNACIATMAGPAGYSLLDNAGLLVVDDKIAWLGEMRDCAGIEATTQIDCEGRLVTPGFIDCHTHLVYGGDRADEFEQRLEGLSYAEIASRGGGIHSTVIATCEASEAELLKQAKPRIEQLISEGVTTLEIKSGYGLDCENEIKMLRVAQKLGEQYGIRVLKTLLGAHAVPERYQGKADDYITLVCDHILPQAQHEGLVDAVDVFIESIAFNRAQARRVFEASKALGLPVKAHAEQLSNMGGAALAAEFNAVSVDHLEYLTEEDVAKLTDTVAVLLPGAFYLLGETRLPPLAALRKNDIPIAIATDCNPGSSPLHSILLAMNMACTQFGLTPREALRGVTINAAQALGLQNSIGSLQVGKQADVVIWDVTKPSMLAYQIGLNPCSAIMQAGAWRKFPDEGFA
ncbi:MAG: imidazolonepropionase [Gammaproteobacteria bacterium]|nr:imidazolonepropionase [Gammaproteobacteria bacterium]